MQGFWLFNMLSAITSLLLWQHYNFSREKASNWKFPGLKLDLKAFKSLIAIHT